MTTIKDEVVDRNLIKRKMIVSSGVDKHENERSCLLGWKTGSTVNGVAKNKDVQIRE